MLLQIIPELAAEGLLAMRVAELKDLSLDLLLLWRRYWWLGLCLSPPSRRIAVGLGKRIGWAGLRVDGIRHCHHGRVAGVLVDHRRGYGHDRRPKIRAAAASPRVTVQHAARERSIRTNGEAQSEQDLG
jgi:hypothetical protein